MTKENKKFYYSEVEDKVIVNSILADFKKRQEDRKPYELSWELNMNFYLGNQYSYISNVGDVCDIEKNYYWENRDVFNHIAPVIESRLAKLNKVKPILNVNPSSNSDYDLYSSKLAKSILTASMENNNFNNLISTATHWSEITGTAFYKISWENDLGDIIGEVNSTKIKNGDIKISVCSPFEIYPDSNSSLEINDCNSIIEARAVPVSYVNSTWSQNVQGEDVDIFEINNNSFNSNISGRGNITKIIHSKKSEHVLLIERYEKPNKNHPNGKLTIVCQDKLLYDGDLPYQVGSNKNRGYPFVKQVSIKQLACFWGMSVIERCIPIQRAYNAIKNKKHEYISRLASGVLAVEDGSVDIDNLETDGLAPGKILIYRNGSTAPQFLSPGTVPSDLEKEEENLLAELNNMCCISDLTTNSSVPGNVNSGSALTLLIEQDESRLSLIAEHIRTAIKEVGTKIIRLYKQYADKLRLNKFLDSNGNIELYYWTNNDLTSDDIQFESKNELEESIENKRAALLSILDKGILSDSSGNISHENKVKLLELLGFKNWNIPEDIETLHKNRAINENLKFSKLEILDVDNHNIHIEEHTKFIITDTTNTIDNDFKNDLLEHIKQHQLLNT